MMTVVAFLSSFSCRASQNPMPSLFLGHAHPERFFHAANNKTGPKTNGANVGRPSLRHLVQEQKTQIALVSSRRFAA